MESDIFRLYNIYNCELRLDRAHRLYNKHALMTVASTLKQWKPKKDFYGNLPSPSNLHIVVDFCKLFIRIHKCKFRDIHYSALAPFILFKVSLKRS